MVSTVKVNGTCPHDCPDACGIVTTVKQGRAVEFSAQVDHPVTQGWLCAKVNRYLEHVYHPDRLQTPLIRIGPKGSGRFERISWDNAIDQISERWRKIIKSHGAEAILPYSYSGTLGLVQMAVSSARFWNRLGASRLERSICMAATRFAVRATLGARKSPPYHHILDSKLLVLWAHNPVSTAPHMMPSVRQAHRQGCKVVVIDPLRTRTARSADLHIRPRPGTDATLAFGIARMIIVSGKHNASWLKKNTQGFDEFAAKVDRYDLDTVSNKTGVSATQISELAELFATKNPAMIRIGDGINRHLEGGKTVQAIACLPALTGQYGVRGGGLGCSTGDYFIWDDEAVNKWSHCPPPGRMVNMNRLGAALNGEAKNPGIQSLFVFCANPMVSAPNTGLIKQGLERPDLFTVVHDLYMTDTARFADLVLPATSQLEHTDLHRGYGHTYLGYNHPAIAPTGESKSNWEVMQLLAKAMGFSDSWLFESADEVIDGVLRETARSTDRLNGINLEELKAEPQIAFASEDEVPFADLRFDTPSGKIELMPLQFTLQSAVDYRIPNTQSNQDTKNTFQLLSPATHHFINSSLANVDSLLAKEKEPVVLIHPEDASRLDIPDGSQIKLFNQRGACVRKVKISEDTMQGVAVALTGYWATSEQHSTVNWTTSDELADYGGQSTFHSNTAQIEKIKVP